MKLHVETPAGQHLIKGYTAEGIILSSQVVSRPLVITPDDLLPDLLPRDISFMEKAHWEAVCKLKPEIVIIGTGGKQIFPDMQHLRPLLFHQIGYEFMDTGAACRTYNILMSEGRRVAGVLFI